MEELIMLLVAVLFNPITWIIVVVILLIRSDNKKKHAAQIAAQNQATAGEDGEFKNNVAPPPPPPKPKDPMAKWNWLLYIAPVLAFTKLSITCAQSVRLLPIRLYV